MIDFCMLFLYLRVLFSVFFHSSFSIDFLDFLHRQLCHLQIETSLLLPIQSECFLFPSLMLALASSSIFNNSDKSRYPWLIMTATSRQEWNFSSLLSLTKTTLVGELDGQFLQPHFSPTDT